MDSPLYPSKHTMGLSGRLASSLEPLLYGIIAASSAIYIGLIASGIWNAIWAKDMNSVTFLQLAQAHKLRDMSITSCVLGWATVGFSVFLIVILYNFGSAFVVHISLATLTVVIGIVHVVILCLLIKNTNSEGRVKIKESFETLLAQGNAYIVNWWSEHCSATEDCGKKYINYMCRRGFIANLVIIGVFGCGFLGAIVVLSCMAAVKPIDRDQQEEDEGARGSRAPLNIDEETEQA